MLKFYGKNKKERTDRGRSIKIQWIAKPAKNNEVANPNDQMVHDIDAV